VLFCSFYSRYNMAAFMFLPFCHSHENGNPVFNFLDSRVRGNDPPAMLCIALRAGNHAKRIWLWLLQDSAHEICGLDML